jgi:DNA-directed RNA polymerase subunit RPC12/RpoP
MKISIAPDTEVRCSYCGDKFQIKNGRRAGAFRGRLLYYCGYCEAVVFGNEADDYPPKIWSREDIEEMKKIGHITNRP